MKYVTLIQQTLFVHFIALFRLTYTYKIHSLVGPNLRMKSDLYVNVHFKDVMLGDAIRVIHSPERWATGVGIMAGLPTFTPSDVEGPLIYGDECMVRFGAFGSTLRLIGKMQLKSKVTITSPESDIPHTIIDTTIIPDKNHTRHLTLCIHIRSEYPIPYMSQDLKVALQYGLFRCIDPDINEIEKLVLYRQLLKATES